MVHKTAFVRSSGGKRDEVFQTPRQPRCGIYPWQPWLCVLNVHQDRQRQEDRTVIVENFRDLTFKSIIHSRKQGAQNNSQRIPLNLSAALSGKLVHITEIKWIFCPLPPNFPCLIWWNHQPCGHWCHKFWNHPQLCFFFKPLTSNKILLILPLQ